MRTENGNIKKVLSMVFVLFLFIGFIRNGSYTEIAKISEYLGQQDFDGKESITIGSLESDFSASLFNKKKLIDFNGTMARILNMQGYYSDMGMYITDDNYIVSAYDYTSTDYEVQQTVGFRDFLEANGVKLLYVNEPTKYTDDSLFQESFGIKTYSNQNADLFLSRIREAGINAIDLRENILDDNLNSFDLFYRTDHHWTTSAGLWATRIIAEGLNAFCGYNIDLSLYNVENFNSKEWKECWLGEQGRKIGKSYTGLDDYTEIKPRYATDFTFKNADGSTWNGTFDNFINEGVYNTENDVYVNGSWHYSYNRINCINNNVDVGKVLIIGDSYEHVIQPFISLGVHEVDSLILRDCGDDFSLRNYILENGYDTVIIAYAQFMVGAHDDVTSANYKMFTFDK